MRVVLRDDVESLGKKGDLVDVADGYAQLPRAARARDEGDAWRRGPGRVDATQP